MSVYGPVGVRVDDQGMNYLKKPLSSTEKNTLTAHFGVPDRVDRKARHWDNINMIELIDALAAEEKNEVLSERFYMTYLLENTSYISYISPNVYTPEQNFAFQTASNNYSLMQRIPNGAVPIAVTDNQETIRAQKTNFGIAYHASMVALRDPRTAPRILESAMKHFQMSTRLTVDLQTINAWLRSGHERVVRELRGDSSLAISPQRVLAIELSDFMAFAQGEDVGFSLLNSKRNSSPEIDCLIVPQGLSQMMYTPDTQNATNVESFFKIFDDDDYKVLKIEGPKNVRQLKGGLKLFEQPSYKIGPNSKDFNPLLNVVTIGQYQCADAVAHKFGWVKRSSRVGAYDFMEGLNVPLDEPRALQYSKLFDFSSKGGWTKEVIGEVRRINSTKPVKAPRGHSDEDKREYERVMINDVSYIDFKPNNSDHRGFGVRDQPIFATWDPVKKEYFLPQLIGDFERYFLPTGAVFKNAHTALTHVVTELKIDVSKTLEDLKNLVRDLESQPYNHKWIRELIKANVKYVLEKRGDAYFIGGEKTPSDLALSKKMQPVVQFKTNEYGSMDLPPITPEIEHVKPIGFVSASGFRTIAAERRKLNSPYRALAHQVGQVIDDLDRIANKLKEIYANSKLFDQLNRPINLHVWDPTQCVFDAVLPSRSPMFLAVVPPVDSREEDKEDEPTPKKDMQGTTLSLSEFIKTGGVGVGGTTKVIIKNAKGEPTEVDIPLFNSTVNFSNPLAPVLHFYGILSRSALEVIENTFDDKRFDAKNYAHYINNVTQLLDNATIKSLFADDGATPWRTWVASSLVLLTSKSERLMNLVKFRLDTKKREEALEIVKGLLSEQTNADLVAKQKTEKPTFRVAVDENRSHHDELYRKGEAVASYDNYISRMDEFYNKMLTLGVLEETTLQEKINKAGPELKKQLEELQVELQDLKSVFMARSGAPAAPKVQVPRELLDREIVLDFENPQSYAMAAWIRTPLFCSPHFNKSAVTSASMPLALPADPFMDYRFPIALSPLSIGMLNHPTMITIDDYFSKHQVRNVHTLNKSNIAIALAAANNKGTYRASPAPPPSRRYDRRGARNAASSSNVAFSRASSGAEIFDVDDLESVEARFTNSSFYPFNDDGDQSGKSVPAQIFHPEVNEYLKGPWAERFLEMAEITDPFLRLAMYAYTFMPCDGFSISNMLRYGLFPPFDLVFFRLWITYASWSFILAAGEGKMCQTFIDEPMVTVSADNQHREVDFASFLNFKSLVHRPENLIVLKNMAPAGYIGGLNTQFFNYDKKDNTKEWEMPIDQRPSIIVGVKPLTERLTNVMRFDNSDLAPEFSVYNKGYNQHKWSMGHFYARAYQPLVQRAEADESASINDYSKHHQISMTVCRGPQVVINQDGNGWVRQDGTGPGGLLSQNCREANDVWQGRRARFPSTNVHIDVKTTLL